MMLYSLWRGIALPTRIEIAHAFGIKKHGPTHVRDNIVESDGYLINEVEAALNVDKLQAYLGSDERDEATLVKMLVNKIEGNVDTTSDKVSMLEVEGVVVPKEIVELASEQESILAKVEVEVPKKVRKPRAKKANGKA